MVVVTENDKVGRIQSSQLMNSAVLSQKHRLTVCITNHMAKRTIAIFETTITKNTQSCIVWNRTYYKKTSSIFYFPSSFLRNAGDYRIEIPVSLSSGYHIRSI